MMRAFGRVTDDGELLTRLARAEWVQRYRQFVDATNRKDAKGKPVIKWPKGLFDKVVALEEGFDASTSPPEKLDEYARLVQPVYPALKPLSEMRSEVKQKLDARYARPDFVPTVPAVGGFNRVQWNEWYLHGTRNFGAILVDGVCSPAISEMVDPDPIGSSPPPRWWDTHGYRPSMSAVTAAQRRGYDFGYSWLGHWREAVFNWYAGLSPADRLTVSKYFDSDTALPIKTKAEKDATADTLGAMTLFFVTERQGTAESYGRSAAGAVLEINPAYAQAFDIIEDELQGENSHAILIPPGLCPQIDWRGIKYKGDRLGGWRY